MITEKNVKKTEQEMNQAALSLQETGCETDQGMLSLQQALDKMAAETPEMPEQFRQGWRDAIRNETHTPKAADQKEASSRIRFSWRRGLSIAAVFAFLLGGTLLGQDAVRLTRMQPVTQNPVSSSSTESLMEKEVRETDILTTEQPADSIAAISEEDDMAVNSFTVTSEEDALVSESFWDEDVSGDMSTGPDAESISISNEEDGLSLESGRDEEESADMDEGAGQTDPVSNSAFSSILSKEAPASGVSEETIESADIEETEWDAAPLTAYVEEVANEDMAVFEEAVEETTEEAEEDMPVEKGSQTIAFTTGSSSGLKAESRDSSSLRVLGYALIGLSFILVAILMILRKK